MIAVHAPLRIVLYEGAGSAPLEPAVRLEATRRLLGSGYKVARVRPDGRVAPNLSDRLVVLGRFETKLPPELEGSESPGGLEAHSVEGMSADEIVAVVEKVRVERAAPTRAAWKPWFPVIDYDRCTNCMQCLSFCLFDVYGVSTDAKIQVQNQSNCKTDCPACSRVCPEVAILFPKYKAGPINGDEVDAEDMRREAMKVDISALLGGDIYAMLRDRSAKAKSRFSKERDEDRALKERLRCLNKLQQSMDIPAEVFAALPSVEEIQAKAEQAKLRAEAALKAAAASPAGS